MVDEGWHPEYIARYICSCSHVSYSRVVLSAIAFQRAKIEAHVARLRAREARRRAAIEEAQAMPYIVSAIVRQGGVTGK